MLSDQNFGLFLYRVPTHGLKHFFSNFTEQFYGLIFMRVILVDSNHKELQLSPRNFDNKLVLSALNHTFLAVEQNFAFCWQSLNLCEVLKELSSF